MLVEPALLLGEIGRRRLVAGRVVAAAGIAVGAAPLGEDQLAQLVGFVLPAIYLTYSIFFGENATANPWGAKGLEWETASPPPTENFPVTPIVTTPAYAYTREEIHVV